LHQEIVHRLTIIRQVKQEFAHHESFEVRIFVGFHVSPDLKFTTRTNLPLPKGSDIQNRNSVPASCWQTSTGWDRRVLGNSCSLEQLEHNAPKGCCAKPKGDDLFEWVAVIEGPEDTVYRGGIFFIELHIPDDYPFHPPTVHFNVVFLTQIYHCNISRGMVCADILRHGWTPSMTISTILQAIVSLLYVCNPADPLVPTIAEQYLNDRVKFEKMARLWTLRYAS
uniref:AT30415p (inferred by orthology to a D. melanogaster protein) n=1 Tax=Anisakis simplex TaxID=6269 RepID=A0A0M3IY58_ANISI